MKVLKLLCYDFQNFKCQTSMFEEIKIREESFDEFYIKHLCLRQRKFLEPKIVRKMMRYLPKRFRTKVIIIGESKNLDTIKIDAFIGSLQNFDLSLLQTSRNKSMDLKTIKEEDIDPSNDDLDLKTINIQFYYNKSWVLKIGFISHAILNSQS